jgi:hypothetical protein
MVPVGDLYVLESFKVDFLFSFSCLQLFEEMGKAFRLLCTVFDEDLIRDVTEKFRVWRFVWLGRSVVLFKRLEEFLRILSLLDQGSCLVFQASNFHLGADVVEMQSFDLYDGKVCILVPGLFPVPVDGGLELGFNNLLRLKVRRLWCWRYQRFLGGFLWEICRAFLR